MQKSVDCTPPSPMQMRRITNECDS